MFLKERECAKLINKLFLEVDMMDELDLRLIGELQKSGRQGYVDLAKVLGVPHDELNGNYSCISKAIDHLGISASK
jgi:hypothetical protein